MSKKYSDTEGCTPVLGSQLLEGLFAELMSQVKQSLDCCHPAVRDKTSLTLEQNLYIVYNVAEGEAKLVLDITKNHKDANLNKKHRAFVKRLKRFYEDIQLIAPEVEDVETLRNFLMCLTMWLQDSHMIMDEEQGREVRDYVSQKGFNHDAKTAKPTLHLLRGGDKGSDAARSLRLSTSLPEDAEGSQGEDERASDGDHKSGVRERDEHRGSSPEARDECQDDSSVEEEGGMGEEPGGSYGHDSSEGSAEYRAEGSELIPDS